MSKKKSGLSKHFQELKEGDRVAIVREKSLKAGFPERIQGKTGTVESKRGKAYVIKIRAGKSKKSKEKRFIIKPIHLKKLT